ncbi:DUF2589 domain-containing protein [Aureibacter tunicatorum]|uniref:DUF2589 domain-containing protein n=1 Tax=Aureibacter tunicatorum TaxID=866807 RepID=A0AAE3XLH4_9BACT|nr:DUF2589 domain-containing protein [Aureibacter tunicatorum]MDR6237139.1 hypothetical protein [Aureibacter tunicatorum]BDD06131.1 hypothetical protein AUTU_36140 [Aureibacter tunicatorum]
MAIDTTPSTVATNALQAIPFSSLIGGPLDAAISAQAQAAKTSWEFIEHVGLNENKDTGQKEAVNVTFMYNKDGKMTKLIVPILTIVPIPYIAVDEININFKANISASSSSVSSSSSSVASSGSVKGTMKAGWGPFSIKSSFGANYSSKKDSKASSESKYSVEYTMDVNVHASQSDMPSGMSAVLNILQQSITGVSKDGDFIFEDLVISEFAGGNFSGKLKVQAMNGTGLYAAGEGVTLTYTGLTDAGDAKVTLPAPTDPLETDSKGRVEFDISGSYTASGDISIEVPFELSMGDLKESGKIYLNGVAPEANGGGGGE